MLYTQPRSVQNTFFLTTVLEPYPPREGIVPCVEGSGRWSGEWSRSLRTRSEQQWKQQCFGCTPCGAAHVVVACSFHCLPRCIETHCPSTRDGWCSMLHTWHQELDVGEHVPCISGSSSVTNPEFQSLRQRIDATLQQRGWSFDVLILNSNAENDAHHKKIQKVHVLFWTNSTGAWYDSVWIQESPRHVWLRKAPCARKPMRCWDPFTTIERFGTFIFSSFLFLYHFWVLCGTLSFLCLLVMTYCTFQVRQLKIFYNTLVSFSAWIHNDTYTSGHQPAARFIQEHISLAYLRQC